MGEGVVGECEGRECVNLGCNVRERCEVRGG